MINVKLTKTKIKYENSSSLYCSKNIQRSKKLWKNGKRCHFVLWEWCELFVLGLT